MGRFAKVLLCDYVLTGILLAILTVLLYQCHLGEEQVNAGIMIIYVVTNFSAGFLMGKLVKVKKYLWGLILGIVYYLLLFLVSVGIYHAVKNGISQTLIGFLLCGGSGMLGGMIS